MADKLWIPKFDDQPARISTGLVFCPDHVDVKFLAPFGLNYKKVELVETTMPRGRHPVFQCVAHQKLIPDPQNPRQRTRLCLRQIGRTDRWIEEKIFKICRCNRCGMVPRQRVWKFSFPTPGVEEELYLGGQEAF